MSKAPAKAEAAEGEAPAKGGKKKDDHHHRGGSGAGHCRRGRLHDDGQEEARRRGRRSRRRGVSHEPPKVKVDPSKPPIFVQLEQFTVNLAPEEGEHFLQSTMVLRVADAKVGDSLKLYMPELKHRIIMLLSSKKPSDLVSAEGRRSSPTRSRKRPTMCSATRPARKKKNKRNRPEDDGPVLAVLFNQFIVQ
jgi:flagellar FliL protein